MIGQLYWFMQIYICINNIIRKLNNVKMDVSMATISFIRYTFHGNYATFSSQTNAPFTMKKNEY